MAKRYSRHRNYRLPDDLVEAVEELAKHNEISESEAIRRLLYAVVIQIDDRNAKRLSAQELNASITDKT